MDYKNLKLKIKEVFDTQEAFAEALGLNRSTLNQKLNGSEWKTSEIAKACDLLHIPLTDAHLYFFVEKV
jgi:DNA-binding XRE family transcriptional regulator